VGQTLGTRIALLRTLHYNGLSNFTACTTAFNMRIPPIPCHSLAFKTNGDYVPVQHQLAAVDIDTTCSTRLTAMTKFINLVLEAITSHMCSQRRSMPQASLCFSLSLYFHNTSIDAIQPYKLTASLNNKNVPSNSLQFQRHCKVFTHKNAPIFRIAALDFRKNQLEFCVRL
jgi:hypothetical protein